MQENTSFSVHHRVGSVRRELRGELLELSKVPHLAILLRRVRSVRRDLRPSGLSSYGADLVKADGEVWEASKSSRSSLLRSILTERTSGGPEGGGILLHLGDAASRRAEAQTQM